MVAAVQLPSTYAISPTAAPGEVDLEVITCEFLPCISGVFVKHESEPDLQDLYRDAVGQSRCLDRIHRSHNH